MKNTERFSNRVDDYVRHRPSYPTAVIKHLREVGYVPDGGVVADIGAGTGIFTELLLDAGHSVIAVEPNAAMAAAMLEQLGDHEKLRCVHAPAEATTLDDASVDLVTAAQALHWFDPKPTRAEFTRITRAPHRLAAIWNRRDVDSSEFLTAYEALLMRYGVGYAETMGRRETLEAFMNPFFGHDDVEIFTAPNVQHHDLNGLLGRLLSSSYGPKPGHANHEPVVEQLRTLFATHARDDKVEMRYQTRVYYGEIH